MTHTKIARLYTEALSVSLRVTLPLAIAVVALLVPSPATAGIISTTGNAKVETDLTKVGAIPNFSQDPAAAARAWLDRAAKRRPLARHLRR
jgi:hypothetical protein